MAVSHRIHPGVGQRQRGRRAALLAAVVLVGFGSLLTVFRESQGIAEEGRAEVEAQAARHLLERPVRRQPESDVPVPPVPAAPTLARNVAPHKLAPGDEIIAAQRISPDDLLDLRDSPLGSTDIDPEELRQQLVEDGFGMIPGVLHRDVALRVRKFLLGLLNAPGAVWKPNEGDNLTDGTLGRVLMGLPPQYYKSLEVIMQNPEMHKYLSKLMPCKGVPGLSQQYRMTQMFITVNDRIRWHVDYPDQPPYKRGKTTMYNPRFCQYKVIFYLQDHTQEGDSGASALSVVPKTHSAQPDYEECKGCPSSGLTCCRAARKGRVPAGHYKSIQLHPRPGDLLVMDARSLHAASHPSLNLPLQPLPTDRELRRPHKYRTFLQFLWGVTDNTFTDVMQKKKDRNLVTRHFSKLVYP
eukprot:TRINITY_DN42885_c0_g1_i1.p1 TRINITY_DN42885_c0_g1~~TRINITY_DN42885_c0_g1_i1.p1  ORF type:complete len:430 (+),score=104.54 TRINITY_DN42885_c0_g1_i1:62-1291(+)